VSISWHIKSSVLGGLTAAALVAASGVQAATVDVGFSRITSNSAENVASQLKVTAAPGDQDGNASGGANAWVTFFFTNAVGVASSISEIYFDDGTILGQVSVVDSFGGYTDFAGGGASPGNLPGGETVTPVFEATAAFSADAVGNPSKGVDAADDILAIVYSLQGSLDFDDLVNTLLDGSLRIGLHLRSIGVAEDSDSFISSRITVTPVPLPAALPLFGTGLALLGLLGWRRRRAG
jgi:hypothetical protein